MSSSFAGPEQASGSTSFGDFDMKPRLEGIGSKPLQAEDLERRRFGIAIESVYYYLEARRVCCAVLLTTSIMLRKGEKMALTQIPLTAKPMAEAGHETEGVDISGHYPISAEYVVVSRRAGWTDIHATPVVKVGALGVNVEASGIGKDQHRVDAQSYTISLKAFRTELAGRPTLVKWEYEDPNGIFYPHETRILVVVAKPILENEVYFPFELRLEKNLKVHVHDPGVFNRIMRYLGATKDDCWRFNIYAPYDPAQAKNALEGAQSPLNKDKVIGLLVAAKPWMDAQGIAALEGAQSPLTEDKVPSATGLHAAANPSMDVEMTS